jgi:hypothetical protein
MSIHLMTTSETNNRNDCRNSIEYFSSATTSGPNCTFSISMTEQSPCKRLRRFELEFGGEAAGAGGRRGIHPGEQGIDWLQAVSLQVIGNDLSGQTRVRDLPPRAGTVVIVVVVAKIGLILLARLGRIMLTSRFGSSAQSDFSEANPLLRTLSKLSRSKCLRPLHQEKLVHLLMCPC